MQSFPETAQVVYHSQIKFLSKMKTWAYSNG